MRCADHMAATRPRRVARAHRVAGASAALALAAALVAAPQAMPTARAQGLPEAGGQLVEQLRRHHAVVLRPLVVGQGDHHVQDLGLAARGTPPPRAL